MSDLSSTAIRKRVNGDATYPTHRSGWCCLINGDSGMGRSAFDIDPPLARTPAKDAITKMVANRGVSGAFGVVVADLATGEVLEDIDGATPQPPASVTKAFTALYAIEALGPNHVFPTRIYADGDISNGILDGNLVLAGGGDPNLVTDQLAELAQRLKATGLREVKGDFLVWDEALVNEDEIDKTQFDYLGYNPTVTGLNLNYNRVHFEWKLEGEDYVTAMDARSENYRPAVTTSQIRVVERPSPVFTYRDVGDTDQWTVAKDALNSEGSRWLPVRHPALYCGEVFATFARSHGIVLKQPKEMAVPPAGAIIAQYDSAPLRDMMRGMLRFSTNLTAEAAGMAATAARVGTPRGLRTSALGMARWADARTGGLHHHSWIIQGWGSVAGLAKRYGQIASGSGGAADTGANFAGHSFGRR